MKVTVANRTLSSLQGGSLENHIISTFKHPSTDLESTCYLYLSSSSRFFKISCFAFIFKFKILQDQLFCIYLQVPRFFKISCLAFIFKFKILQDQLFGIYLQVQDSSRLAVYHLEVEQCKRSSETRKCYLFVIYIYVVG